MFNTIDKSDEDETPQDPTELKLARIKQLVNAIDVSDSSPTSPKRTAYMQKQHLLRGRLNIASVIDSATLSSFCATPKAGVNDAEEASLNRAFSTLKVQKQQRVHNTITHPAKPHYYSHMNSMQPTITLQPLISVVTSPNQSPESKYVTPQLRNLWQLPEQSQNHHHH